MQGRLAAYRRIIQFGYPIFPPHPIFKHLRVTEWKRFFSDSALAFSPVQGTEDPCSLCNIFSDGGNQRDEETA